MFSMVEMYSVGTGGREPVGAVVVEGKRGGSLIVVGVTEKKSSGNCWRSRTRFLRSVSTSAHVKVKIRREFNRRLMKLIMDGEIVRRGHRVL